MTAVLHTIGMAGTRPAMTVGALVRLDDGKRWKSRSLSLTSSMSSPALCRP
jgi:hypothetical protein